MNGNEFFRRLFEGMPLGWRAKFRVGDRVRLIRADLFGFIPVGAEGEIVEIEDAEGYNAQKGRPFYVKFDLRKFGLKLRDRIPPEQLAKWRVEGQPIDPDEPLLESGSYFGPNDVEQVG
jgi:hypothetical protein